MPWAKKIIASHTQNFLRIFVYHRFSHHGVSGRVRLSEFSWQLDQLQKGSWVVLPLRGYLESRNQLAPHQNVVILTIDDGYQDFYQIAYPELKRRNIPATFFVTTDFIDGEIWLWPDRIRYALDHGKSGGAVSLGTTVIPLVLSTPSERARIWQRIVRYCTHVSDVTREYVIKELEQQCQVQLPKTIPDEFAPTSWEQIREMEANGIEIGSHTRRHPILSQVEPEMLGEEISGSKQILEERLRKSVATFCYPNSMPEDITNEVVAAVKTAGYKGAVHGVIPNSEDCYRLSRMGVSDDRVDFLWKLYGLEALFLSKESI